MFSFKVADFLESPVGAFLASEVVFAVTAVVGFLIVDSYRRKAA